MRVDPYLYFNGNCEEAFTFYAATLGATIQFMMPHRGSPAGDMGGPEWADKILHASLALGDTVLLASDAPPTDYHRPAGIAVSLDIDSVEEAERIFHAFSDRAHITMPLQETFWALRFAMLTDRFGIPWLINCPKPIGV